MNIALRFSPVLLLAAGLATAAQDHAAHGHAAPTAAVAAAATTASATAAALTRGEVMRVDARNGRLTVRHEDIANLDMPAMTMVFALAEPQQAAQFKPGDKIRFRAEQDNGALTMTRVELAAD